ncbi:MAG TPA: endopeptidase La [Candidatus Acidoferrales bacterium]|nr:endopeptidase La [Candidatus Acidoferrales bacterium]
MAVNERSGPATNETASGQEEKKRTKSRLPEDALILVPLRNTVLFPSTIAPFTLGRPASVQAVQEAVRHEMPIGLVTQRDGRVETPQPADLYEIGTVADILRIGTLPDGQRQILVQGRRRFKIVDFIQMQPFALARVLYLVERVPQTKDFEARILHLRQQAQRALSLLPEALGELGASLQALDQPSALIDFIASWLDLSVAEKQDVLETLDLEERAKKVSEKLARHIEVLEITKKIGSEAKGAMDKAQREYILREQLKAIQRELGEGDGKGSEIEELRKKIAAAKMPPDVEKEALRELSRLERMPEGAAEYSMVRTYLDWLIELPWSVKTEEEIDIVKARTILDQDHHDLEKVKKRILEFLAIRKLNPAGKSPILCFVGPPGVGKTSLGQSIARAMNRKFVRQSVGGVHDEAEIRGHRRTYIGALPGRIIQAIRKAGSSNPVFMLDEIDKLSASFHGDPSAALLEVLDPEQNSTFQDHYLDVPFDLSQVLFVTTANVLDTIPGPLRDRMEVIEIPGYTEEDKLVIAERYLVKRQLEASGLKPEQLIFTPEALRAIIRGYTREAGVRQLEREIGAVCRGAAIRFAEGHNESITITPEVVADFLGAKKFFDEVALRTSLPGVATGLAWTPVGGDILFVEATKMPGQGRLILTGHLGDVMKESAQAALSLVKSRASKLELEARVFRTQDLHVHIPAGAIPKDGPSAGLTIFVALVSLLTERRVRHDVAMTGEISLRGLVLPVGGIKEKVLAARRAGINCVVLPDLNRKDLEEIPQPLRENLRFEFVETVDQALEIALEKEKRPPANLRSEPPEGFAPPPHA